MATVMSTICQSSLSRYMGKIGLNNNAIIPKIHVHPINLWEKERKDKNVLIPDTTHLRRV